MTGDALAFVALGLWASDFGQIPLELHECPGLAVTVGIMEVALHPAARQALDLSENSKARLALLCKLIDERRAELAPQVKSWSFLTPIPATKNSFEKTPKLVAALREALTPPEFQRLRGLYAAVRGPQLVCDPACAKRFSAPAEAVARLLAAARGTKTSILRAPRSIVNDRATRDLFRSDAKNSLTPADQRALERLADRQWPADLVDEIYASESNYGPHWLHAPTGDWCGSYGSILGLFGNPEILALVKPTAAQKAKIAKLWDDSLAAQTSHYQALTLFPKSQQLELEKAGRPGVAVGLLELENRMLAALEPGQQETAWRIMAQTMTLSMVFGSDSLRRKLGLTKAQQDLDMKEYRRLRIVPSAHEMSGATDAECWAKVAAWEKYDRENPNRQALVDKKLHDEIFTPEQRKTWDGWMHAKLDAPAQDLPQPLTPFAGLRPIVLEPPTGVTWD